MIFQLGSVFSDSMVLQRERPWAVYGTATPGAEVTATVGGVTQSGVADEAGEWSLPFEPLSGKGPIDFKVSSGGKERVLQDVLVGEVWLCSGQSNMGFSLGGSMHAKTDVPEANFENLRLLRLPIRPVGEKQSEFDAQWERCTPESAKPFSGVGYYFGRDVHLESGVPIGLIHSARGGTAIQAWLPYETFTENEAFSHYIEETAELLKRLKKTGESNSPEAMASWEKERDAVLASTQGQEKGWHLEKHDDADWPTMEVPGAFELVLERDFDGAIWYRREVELPDDWTGQALKLDLGVIDDFDETYFNGELVGKVGLETENSHIVQRSYDVPAKLVKKRNLIAVRIVDHFNEGGFMGPGTMMRLSPKGGINGVDPVGLAGKWKFQIEQELRPQPAPPNYSRLGAYHYNGMIHPLLRFPIRGMLWYQGEANANEREAVLYEKLLCTLRETWRKLWGIEDMLFYVVQLPNFKMRIDEAVETDWANMRESQFRACEVDALSELAVTIDVGEADDIHPTDKRTVGQRLALIANHKVYGKQSEAGLAACHGPSPKALKAESGKVTITYDFAGKGLVLRGEEALGVFHVADAHGKFSNAKASIVDEHTVELICDGVEKPSRVRYAWGDNPLANLYNSEGLPGRPFQMDV